MVFYTEYASPIGTLTLASDRAHLVGLWLAGQKHFLAPLQEVPVRQDDAAPFAAAKDWLDRYFAGHRPTPSELPLKPFGSAFRQAVWKVLCAIPYGEVVTYGSIAKELAAKGIPTSARAVGGAVGHNPISIVIPCHRVVGANGALTGYAGGLDRKIALLTLEGVALRSEIQIQGRK